MKEHHNDSRTTNFKQSWFWKQIINNKVVSVLLVSLLIFFNIFMLGKISGIFQPIEIVLSIVGPPVVFSTIFYYLLNPVVDWLEKKRFTRNTAIAFVFSLIILLIIVGINFIVPIIQRQLESLIENWPVYWNSLMVQLDELLGTEAFTGFMDKMSETSLIDNLSGQASRVSKCYSRRNWKFYWYLDTGRDYFYLRLLLSFITLLKEGDKVPDNILRVLPTRFAGI